MTQLKKRIRENGIDYILVGDYYIPELALPEETRPIGKYGCLHRNFLKNHHRAIFSSLCLSGELWTYLADVEEQAQIRLDCIMAQMKEAEGVTEQLKEQEQMLWVQKVNSIHNRAEEIILSEIIYNLV